MGLDMYLYKRTYVGANREHRNVVLDISLQINGKPVHIDKNRVSYIIEEICYWRKANAIHRWFVDNVQDGIDECGEYDVSGAQLQDLVNICKKVEDDLSLASELLPTQEGFFFGETDYGNYYKEDLKDTINNLTKVLEEPNGINSEYIYRSSW